MRSNIALLMTVLLTLGAGVVVGRLWGRLPVTAASSTHSWLADQLHLTDDQRQQMDAIWADTRHKMDSMGDRRHALETDRDKAVHDLLNPTEQQSYDAVIKDYHTKRAELDKYREQIMHDAEDRSKALLTDDQKKDWENLTNKMHDRSSHHGAADDGSPPRDAPAGSPASMPTTVP